MADMESSLKNHLALKTPGKMPYLGIIHRLDQPVSGILVFAKTPAAAKDLNRQLTTSGFGKHYYALVAGTPEPTSADFRKLPCKRCQNKYFQNLSERYCRCQISKASLWFSWYYIFCWYCFRNSCRDQPAKNQVRYWTPSSNSCAAFRYGLPDHRWHEV